MKKTVSILGAIALIMAGVLTLSCTKLEDEQTSNGRVSYRISVSRSETTKALAEIAEPLSLSKSFAVNEKIALVYKVGGVTKVKESNALTSGDILREGKSADFSITFEPLEQLPDANSEVKYIYPASLAKADGSVNYDALNTQDGSLSYVATNLDLGIFAGTLDGTTLPANVTLSNEFTICKFAIKEGDTDMTSSVTKLTIKNGSNVYRVNTSSLDGIWVAMRPVTSGDILVCAAKGKDLYTKTVSDKNLAAGKYYPVTVTTTQIPGAISGLFTINGNGDWVCFSQGNLRAKYENSAWTWSFADHQWDALHSSQSDTDGRDLFCWATKTNPGNTSYTSSSWAEWGDNKITNGGNNENSGWFTPSSDNWGYILNSRSTPSNVRFAQAKVNGVNGLIVLPDDWNIDYHVLNYINQFDGNNGMYEKNVISDTDWTNDFETHGAVFLPTTGFRWQSQFQHFDVDGFYWTSSGVNANNAYAITFLGSGYSIRVKYNDSYQKYTDCSVRLVRRL